MIIIFGIMEINVMGAKNKLLYIENCCGECYREFLDYAFQKNNYFMLVYVNYYNKGYARQIKEIKNKLKLFQVKRRTNPSWPGTPNTFCIDTTYQVIFYKTESDAKKVLQRVDSIIEWKSPDYPQDLAFFKGNDCWFFSVAHENIAVIINPDESDISFVKHLGLYKNENLIESKTKYFEFFENEKKHDPL